MPVTLAHPAAVLPLRWLPLPTTALVVGSMVPDLPVFLGSWGVYGVTHSWPGILTVDLLLTLAALALWFWFVRDAAVDMAPGPVRSRVAARFRPTAREWLLALPAACLGAATHVVWDSFTHPHRWGSRHVEWLRTDHAGQPGSKWLQYASGVVGLAVVTWAVVRHLRSLDPHGSTRPRVLHRGALPAAVAAAGLVGLASAVLHAPDLHDMAYHAVVHGLIGFVVLGLLACTVWHAVRRAAPASR